MLLPPMSASHCEGLRQRPVRDRRAHDEQGDGGRDERQRVAPLVAIEAGRDELPDLPEDHRHRQRDRDVRRELEADRESFERAGDEEVAAGDAARRDLAVGVQQKAEDRRVQEPAGDGRDADGDATEDDAAPQLEQVLHQGHATLVGCSSRECFRTHRRRTRYAAGSSGLDCGVVPGSGSSFTVSSGGR